MKITHIKETCLYSRDLNRAQIFYEQVMKLPLISRAGNRHVFFRAGASVLLIFNPEETAHETQLPPHYGSGKLHLAFEVERDDYVNCKKTLAKAGVEIIHEQEWKGGRKSFYFHDPDGHVLEIVMPGIWE